MGSDGEIPPLDFNTFVISMSTACMAHLGEVEHPDDAAGRAPRANLPMARQTLDILEMLEVKTQGNLSGEEERLFSQILSDLREAYERASAA